LITPPSLNFQALIRKTQTLAPAFLKEVSFFINELSDTVFTVKVRHYCGRAIIEAAQLNEKK